MKVGLQLFSVRNEMAKDPLGTIEQCAEIGYKYLQIANFFDKNANEHDLVCGFGVSPDDFKKKCDELGIALLPSHVGGMTPEEMDELCEVQKYIGADGLITPALFVHTQEDIDNACKYMNTIGEICAKHGMSYYYHNHNHEFQVLYGKTVLEHFMDGTDPALVQFELDTYWAARGGADPIELMERYGKRCSLLHQKDYPKGHEDEFVQQVYLDPELDIDLQKFVDYKDKLFAEVGTGCMDIQAIIDKAAEIGACDYIILEQDDTELNQIDSIRISMDAFRKYDNIEF